MISAARAPAAKTAPLASEAADALIGAADAHVSPLASEATALPSVEAVVRPSDVPHTDEAEAVGQPTVKALVRRPSDVPSSAEAAGLPTVEAVVRPSDVEACDADDDAGPITLEAWR